MGNALTAGIELGREAGQPVPVAGAEHHPAAVAQHPLRHCLAQAGAHPGHDDRLALEHHGRMVAHVTGS